MRTLIDQDPYLNRPDQARWSMRGSWPCSWISIVPDAPTPLVAAFRRRFELDHALALRIHVSADERYELFLDGERIGRGSERGDAHNWFFETYDLQLEPGTHTLVAQVWALGRAAPIAQMSVYPGVLVAPQADEHLPLLGTGVAEWEGQLLAGYRFVDTAPRGGHAYFAVGEQVVVEGRQLAWGFERGEGNGWGPVRVLDAGYIATTRFEYAPAHLLRPATLPPMLDQPCAPGIVRSITAPLAGEAPALRAADHRGEEQAAWDGILRDGQPLTLPPATRRRIVIDLERYHCAYPELVVSGGAGSSVRLHWAESLYNEPEGRTKGDRSAIEGKYFVGMGDTYMPDGGASRTFRSLWWGCGRYIELSVATEAEELTIERLTLHETRYPLEQESTFTASDTRLQQIMPIMVRALQMCAHETYMDCPYYEQLMYIGDTRLEALITYVTTGDDRLPRKALRMFDASRLASGLTQSRYPSRVTQIIPPFSLWWVAMVHDYAIWRDDAAFVRSLMPGVREVLDRFASFLNADGLVEAPPGWNFVDWVPAWASGAPPDGEHGVSGVINWQFALVLSLAARLEGWVGEPELAARNYSRAAALAARLDEHFWDEQRGLYADDLQHQHFSEHAQCMAILSGQLEEARQQRVAQGLLQEPGLARTTIYFSHYLFEAFAALGRIDALFERLQLWFDLPAQGFTTTFESPEPSRSDCHAWGAHPLYHYFASILGIRPASPGFAEVEIRPQLGALTYVRGELVHPRGQIEVELRVEQHQINGSIRLPDGIAGRLVLGGRIMALAAGENMVLLDKEQS